MSQWLRKGLVSILAIAAATLWGFVAGAMQAPSAVVSLGALGIFAGIMTWGLKGRSTQEQTQAAIMARWEREQAQS
jgi:ribose/xylose/arabinose/galactoside ABC-type transport system permease subunit